VVPEHSLEFRPEPLCLGPWLREVARQRADEIAVAAAAKDLEPGDATFGDACSVISERAPLRAVARTHAGPPTYIQ
ncbi:MAG: hypothetical protein ACREFQ_10550, partial [Stellaceae bacterium]